MTMTLVNMAHIWVQFSCLSFDGSPASPQDGIKTMPVMMMMMMILDLKIYRKKPFWQKSLPNTVYKQVLLSIF